jgi:ABC-type nitrate/sulfonate/bicarbonate transport system substrate-binding protein
MNNEKIRSSRRRRISRRDLLQTTLGASGILAAGGMSMLAPGLMRPAIAQAPRSSLDKVQIWMAVGSIEFLWAVLKARKIDEKHGLNIEVTYLDANAINQGLMIGQVSVGSSQPITAAVANNAGKNLTMFGPTLWNNIAGVVPVNSPVTSLKDLVGKKVALLQKLSGVYTSTQVMAAELGLNFEKDFNVVTGPPPAVSAFLQRGDVDAAVQIEPLVSSLLLTGKYKIFLEVNQVWKQLTGQDMLLGALAAEQKWLDANKDVAKRIIAAITDTGKLIRSDLSVFDEFASTLQLKTPEEIAFAKKRLPGFYPSEWTPSSVANVKRIIDRADELGIVKKPNREIVVAL